jgi:hypothetical protein
VLVENAKGREIAFVVQLALLALKIVITIEKSAPLMEFNCI